MARGGELSGGDGPCWGYLGSDSDSGAKLEVGSAPPALGGAAVVAVRVGELVGEGQARLQPDGRVPIATVLGEGMQGVESPLHPGGLAPKEGRGHVAKWPRQAARAGGVGGRLGLGGGGKAIASEACHTLTPASCAAKLKAKRLALPTKPVASWQLAGN